MTQYTYALQLLEHIRTNGLDPVYIDKLREIVANNAYRGEHNDNSFDLTTWSRLRLTVNTLANALSVLDTWRPQ